MDRAVSLYQKCVACGGVFPRTQADGSTYFHACGPVFNPATRLHEERPNKRDENVTLDPTTKKAVPIAAGDGVIDAVKPAPIPEPEPTLDEVKP
jgi:hypothetical protein